MSFKMIYDKRNRDNIDKLADNTKQKVLQLYQYCIDNKIQILIYETIRTKEKQAENVRKGVSKTMKSYHLVGQALDWVLVDSKKNALWNGYKTTDAQKVVRYAKSIGFEWGGDWKNFYDAPHLQYNYKGYGTDSFGKSPSVTPPNNNSKGDDILEFTSDTTKNAVRDELQQAFDKKLIDKSWLDKFDKGYMKNGDYAGLKLIISQRSVGK